MQHRVIVSLNGSGADSRVLHTAMTLARAFGAVLYVVDVHEGRKRPPGGGTSGPPAMQDAYFALSKAGGLPDDVDARIVVLDGESRELARLADRSTDLLVVARSAGGNDSPGVVGPIPQGCVARANCPVVLVPATVPEGVEHSADEPHAPPHPKSVPELSDPAGPPGLGADRERERGCRRRDPAGRAAADPRGIGPTPRPQADRRLAGAHRRRAPQLAAPHRPTRAWPRQWQRTGADVSNGRFRADPAEPVNGHRALPRWADTLAVGIVEIVVEPITPDGAGLDIVQEWGEQSFPASDPPANW